MGLLGRLTDGEVRVHKIAPSVRVLVGPRRPGNATESHLTSDPFATGAPLQSTKVDISFARRELVLGAHVAKSTGAAAFIKEGGKENGEKSKETI